MTDFDQLIKEKVNSKEYTYSAKSWQSFTQKAGWEGGFTLGHALLTGVAVVLVAIGTYVAVHSMGNEGDQIAPTIQKQPANEAIIAQDSITETENPVTAEAFETPAASPTTPTADNGRVNSPQTESAPAESSNLDTVTTNKTPVQKPIRRERITRIFEINTDTISSNDF